VFRKNIIYGKQFSKIKSVKIINFANTSCLIYIWLKWCAD